MSDIAVTIFIVVSTVIGFLWSLKYYNETVAYSPTIHENVAYNSNEKSALVNGDSAMDLPGQHHDEKQHHMTVSKIQEQLTSVSEAIQDGSKGFLKAEYQYMGVFMVMMSIALMLFLGFRDVDDSWVNAIFTTVAFLVGSTTSIISGWVGMTIAVLANVRTTAIAYNNPGDYGKPFVMSFKAGAVMGFSLVSVGILNLYILVSLFSLYFDTSDAEKTRVMYEAVAGYGLGGSSIALFGRVGGGIFTKAADVGADMFKLEGLDEDDPRNPAVIADNVGDNVGDIAGMGADLFGSFAESSCAAMVVSASSADLFDNWAVMCFPMLVAAAGVLVCLVTSLFATHCCLVAKEADVEASLKRQLIISTVLMTPVAFILCYVVFPSGAFEVSTANQCKYWYIFICLACGLWSGLAIGLITEYYTSKTHPPTRELAEESSKGAAVNIIYGLALGYKSVIIPVFCLAITIYISYSLAGMYGVACGAIGILSTLSIGLTIDAYGPICDNAGGIAEMSHMPENVRLVTDALDAAGNTTAAIGKGFAIGSAAMVSLALFGAFVTTISPDELPAVDILDPWVFFGLLVGAMLPYWFSAMTMKSVGKAAGEMVKEVQRQFDELNLLDEHNPGTPEYNKCVAISTEASLKEMIAPGCLVLLSPLFCGYLLGVKALAGMLAGILVSGVQMAISASNSGGAWDNAKKFVEESEKTWVENKDGVKVQKTGKGSAHHGAAVIGDTVGDPMKDTSGPALNILIKLSAITSLVFGSSMATSWDQPGLIQRLFN